MSLWALKPLWGWGGAGGWGVVLLPLMALGGFAEATFGGCTVVGSRGFLSSLGRWSSFLFFSEAFSFFGCEAARDRELAEEMGLARSAYMSSESALRTELLEEETLETDETLLTLKDLDFLDFRDAEGECDMDADEEEPE